MSNYSESGTFSTSGNNGGSGARRHSIDFLFVIVLLLFLMVTSVLMILLGTGVYRRVLASMSDNYDARTCQAYVLQKVRRGQAAGQVEAGELEGVSEVPGPDEEARAQDRERPAGVVHGRDRWASGQEGETRRRLGRDHSRWRGA